MNGVEVLGFRRATELCGLLWRSGHLYGVSDSFKSREVYPVFDLEWFPADLIDKGARVCGRGYWLSSDSPKEPVAFINACDYDVEGETIGYNILRYACGGKESVALRAKFSTLTETNSCLLSEEPRPGLANGLARAGRTRHALDFIWGVNLSRALSTSLSTPALLRL